MRLDRVLYLELIKFCSKNVICDVFQVFHLYAVCCNSLFLCNNYGLTFQL